MSDVHHTALIVLCSDLCMNHAALKPLTVTEYLDLTHKLAAIHRTPADLFQLDWEQICAEAHIDDKLIVRIGDLLARAGNIGLAQSMLESLGIWITTYDDSTYPTRIRMLADEAPRVLYYSGNLAIANNPQSVAVLSDRDGGTSSINQSSESHTQRILVTTDSLQQVIRLKHHRNGIINDQLLCISLTNPDAPTPPEHYPVVMRVIDALTGALTPDNKPQEIPSARPKSSAKSKKDQLIASGQAQFWGESDN
jgi:hypothetical protein